MPPCCSCLSGLPRCLEEDLPLPLRPGLKGERARLLPVGDRLGSAPLLLLSLEGEIVASCDTFTGTQHVSFVHTVSGCFSKGRFRLDKPICDSRCAFASCTWRLVM